MSRKKQTTPRPMFFGYERDFAMRWCPVVCHGDQPIIHKGEAHRFSQFRPVPAECIDPAGEPLFGKLQALFQAPAKEAA